MQQALNLSGIHPEGGRPADAARQLATMRQSPAPSPQAHAPLPWELAGLTICGLTFWFFLGFPFCNHNESYYWIALFQTKPAWEILTAKLEAVATFRPLAQALAYGSYQVGDGHAFTQLINYLITAGAWIFLCLTSPAKRALAWLSAALGAGFFAGYIYLFHIHGIFYGPLLWLPPLLIWIHGQEKSDAWKDFASLAACLLMALFHPYALILCGFFVVGTCAETWDKRRSLGAARRLPILAAVAALILLARPEHHRPDLSSNFAGLLESFALLEAHQLLQALSFLLAALAAFGEQGLRLEAKAGLAALALAASIVLAMAGLPVLLVWIAACLGKTAMRRQWPLFFLIAGAASLPALAPSGSPTYAIYCVMLCAVAASQDLPWPKGAAFQRVEKAVIRGGLAAAVLLVIALRNSIEIPLLSNLARPVLAEREKTCQLEAIVRWWEGSEYRGLPLVFHRDAQNPVDLPQQALERRENRPPTYQGYLDTYLGMLGHRQPRESAAGTLVITFGNQRVPGLRLVKRIEGRSAGEAFVYLAGI